MFTGSNTEPAYPNNSLLKAWSAGYTCLCPLLQPGLTADAAQATSRNWRGNSSMLIGRAKW